MDFFLINLLTSAGDGSETGGSDWTMFIFFIILVVAFVAILIFNNRSNKKRQQEQEATMNALRPGNKVKTIGGVCGIVVEVNDEENTFVLETGNELNGKSYLKFDKQAIYQTDAKPDTNKETKEKEENVTEEKTTEEEQKEEK